MMTRRFLACDLGALLLPVVSTFSPVDFVPAPAVDSGLLWMARRARPLVDDRRLYREFLGRAFSDRGTSVRRRLDPLFSARQVARLARDLRFDPTGPPGRLSFDQWLGLYRYWSHEHRAQHRKRR